MGVWIETTTRLKRDQILGVTPFVGVWIETTLELYKYNYQLSHPSWVCGLKHIVLGTQIINITVTPFVGVWIETLGLTH